MADSFSGEKVSRISVVVPLDARPAGVCVSIGDFVNNVQSTAAQESFSMAEPGNEVQREKCAPEDIFFFSKYILIFRRQNTSFSIHRTERPSLCISAHKLVLSNVITGGHTGWDCVLAQS